MSELFAFVTSTKVIICVVTSMPSAFHKRFGFHKVFSKVIWRICLVKLISDTFKSLVTTSSSSFGAFECSRIFLQFSLLVLSPMQDMQDRNLFSCSFFSKLNSTFRQPSATINTHRIGNCLSTIGDY